jgi:cytochrome c553
MKCHAAAALLAALLLAPAAAAADAARGQTLAVACAACHGEDGNAKTEKTPSLAGHPAPYLTLQLILFRERQRQNEIMTPIAQALSDDDMTALAAFFAAQKRVPVTPAASAAAARGREIADASRCGTCHLPDYAGREQIPRLAAQREDYLLTTMRDYKAGRRSGVDGMMTSVLYNHGEDDLIALAAYLAQLP